MKSTTLFFATILSFTFLLSACAGSGRRPSNSDNYSRSRRKARPMNHRRLDSESLYKACLKERPEVTCRTRLGR